MTLHIITVSVRLLLCSTTKMYTIMEILQETSAAGTIGQIVANNFRTAEVFRKYKIDFCCKGNRQLAEVCNEKGLELDTIEQELLDKVTRAGTATDTDFREMPLDDLANLILDRHHTYVRESIPVLLAFLTKVNKVHGNNHPELNEVLMLFIGCAEELTHHMLKEEAILFPAIKKLVETERLAGKMSTPFFFGTLSGPVNAMKGEHSTEGERAARLTEITANFTPPEDACTTYKVAYQKLEEFINDLYTHIHLENNILFPAALEVETRIGVPLS